MLVKNTGTNQQTQVITRQIGATSVTSTTAIKEGMSTDTHSSTFEQLRRGYNNNKRPSTNILVPPAAKKPNIEDVKEFSEQQRMRKQIAAEFGEDPEYESILDDDIHDDDDDDDNAGQAAGANVSGDTKQVQRQKQQQQQQQQLMQTHEQATITIKQGIGDQPATIIVKDASNSKMNHEKIISEVLRQYPYLVKGSKNIKLKIMPNAGSGHNQRAVKKTEATQSANTTANESYASSETSGISIKKSGTAELHIKDDKTKNQQNIQILGVPTSTTAAATGTNIQKRRIDSKTMHSLIAMGAENMTGPWLCLRCGINGRPISIPSYRSFRRHLVNTHKEAVDPALCEHCGWRSSNDRELHYHLEQEHKIKSTQYTFPVCPICSVELVDSNTLNEHMQENHANEDKQQCIYCNKIFGRELQLYQHMKSYHKKQAIEDGIIDYEDEEYLVESLMQKESESESKVKILSDISLPANEKLGSPSSEAAGLSKMASGIAASIGVHGVDESFENGKVEETKFINADGNEMVLTEEQRKEIMAQLNQENVGGTVMVLQDDENVKATALETEEEDDSQIYKELSGNDVNHDDETLKTTEDKQEPIKQDINQKLKELTGDWSDEDEEMADMPQETSNTETQAESPSSNKEKTVVEEDDIDLALKNLHTDTSFDMETEQLNEESSKDEKQENLDAEVTKESAVDHETETHEEVNELDDSDVVLEHHNEFTEEEFNLKKTTESKYEDELEDKEENTLLDDLLAETHGTKDSDILPVEGERQEAHTSAEELAVEQESEQSKEEEEHEAEAAQEEHAEETATSDKEIQNMKLFEESENEAKTTALEENKTQQTVKSLISEWADDGDDDDDDDKL